MKKKIDLKQQLVDLRGRNIVASPDDPTVMTVGKILGLVIDADKEKKVSPLKKWHLAVECYNKDFVELDEADFAVVKEILERQEIFNTASIVGQVMKAVEDAHTVE